MKKLIFIVTILTFLSSCKIYRVYTKPNKRNLGIPFLAKKVQLEQHTIYQKKFLDLTLEITPMIDDSIAEGMGPVTFGRKRMIYPESKELQEFKSELLSANSIPFSKVLDLIESFDNLEALAVNDSTDNVISNTVERNIVMDETTYYLNGNHHLFGSSKLEFELNDDNTLTKSNAESSSDVTEFASNLLTSVIPVSKIISKKLKLDEIPEEEEEAGEKDTEDQQIVETLGVLGLYDTALEDDIDRLYYEIKLNPEGGVLRYTFIDPVESYDEKTTIEPIPFSLESGMFNIQEIKHSSLESQKPENEEEAEEDENAIQINGKVTLPKN